MDRHEIAEGLGHLLALDLQEAVVHPVVGHHRRAVGAAALRDLVLVVGEDEVDAAAVDVEHLAQRLLRHRRALDVPARAARRLDAAGDGHDGSPGFDGFHSTKSMAPSCRAPRRRARRPPSRRASGWRAGRSPASRPRRTARGPRRRRRARWRTSASISRTMSRFSARGCARSRAARRVGGSTPSAAMSSWNCRVVALGQLADRSISAARSLRRPRVDLVVDVGDVARIGDVLGP